MKSLIPRQFYSFSPVIHPNFIAMEYIPFALSDDGKTLVWVDDPSKGPWIADSDGSKAKRLPAAPSGYRIQAVFCDRTGAKIHYQTIGSKGLKLFVVERAGSNVVPVHSTLHGYYEVANDGVTVHLCQLEVGQERKGSWWAWNGSGLTKTVTHTWPRYRGSWAWSGNGKTLVWRDAAPQRGLSTYVWRAEP